MSKESFSFLSCGCVGRTGKIVEWCEFHDKNQPQEGDPADLYLRTKGDFSEIED